LIDGLPQTDDRAKRGKTMKEMEKNLLHFQFGFVGFVVGFFPAS